LEKEKIIKRTKRPSRGHSSRKRNKLTFRQRQLMKHAFMYQLMMNMGQATLIMMRILTSQSQPTHQKTATFFDLEDVRNGDQYHPMQPNVTYCFFGDRFEIG